MVAPTDLVATEPPRAVTGDFVPDEVLVTVNGDAGAVQQIAASFGLEIRSQRRSGLLGNTLVRLGIPDGRPVGVMEAQLAADGRILRREANHVYSLQQAASTVNYAFERIALDANEASGENVRVGVIDTGIDDKNPALSGIRQFNALPDVPIKARDHGTSVDGLIAGNLLHPAPDRSADWVEKALAATAKDLGPKGRDNDFGFGLLDTKAAEAAKE